MNEKLQELINVIPLIREMTQVDAAVCVWNKDAVVEAFFESSSIAIKFEVGFQVKDVKDPLVVAIQTGRPTYNKVPKEAFGVAFEGTITPIMDRGEVVGAVTYCFSTEAKDEIILETNELAEAITETDKSIDGIMTGTKMLATNMNEVYEFTQMVRDQVQEASKVVDNIQNNAKFSNILALNASIESARAGQAGKGFAVVSEEMRKFSKMSGDAAMLIRNNLIEIEKSLVNVGVNIDQSTKIADEQADAAANLNSLFETVSDKANKVNETCKKNMNL